MELKPQDIVVAIDLATAEAPPPFASLKDGNLSARAISARLGLSLGAVSQSYKRLRTLGWVRTKNTSNRANTSAMREFFIHGVKYYSQPEVVGVGPGMASGWSAKPLKGKSSMVAPETPYVWAGSSGGARGEQITPIHPCAIRLALANRHAYMILALLDVMRLGSFREQGEAKDMLTSLLVLADDKGDLG
ncbi:winged helix-turn-helix domain-containing protein [Marinimicrobium sp. ABcell2]|uniref:winged helix-turn-helix domain-containing protein n=1 Tax=Marinimicrobium sp. ABcell2 TaxID=3069751 RepID=UPI0027AEFCF6|nr:winged helix-turn-helix domain-containing protein [Marinimicrobium sp. ABcell2]MDQ2077359.1 winged helix-turn-helix domain-containing protein [Marinimicrobium sp. ABcell2]